MEEAVKSLSIPSIFILRPSLLLGKRKEFRLGEVIAQRMMSLFGFLFFGRFKKYKGIHAKSVAKAMLRLTKEDMEGKITLESDRIQLYSE
jgi:hypothetical protein